MSPATRTCAKALQCAEGVPTALMHRSTKDSTSFTATHLCWSKHFLLVCKLRIFPTKRLQYLVLPANPAILEKNRPSHLEGNGTEQSLPSRDVSGVSLMGLDDSLILRRQEP